MPNKKSLLEKAKATELHNSGNRRGFTEEELELALAWLNGELRLRQVASVLSKSNSNNVYMFLALAAREIFQGKYDLDKNHENTKKA